MVISKPVLLKDKTYLRFSVEMDGILINGFRVNKSLSILIPPQAQYRGKSYPVVQLSIDAQTKLLEMLDVNYGEEIRNAA